MKNTSPTQQNKKCSVVPLFEVLGSYVEVTLHFGYRLERRIHDKYFVIYRNDNVKKGCEVTARLLRKLAIHECEYLEKLNYS